MRDSSDMELVRDYARLNSEAAFAELVRRHINLAYSAALRNVGNAAHAEEITQAVFIILARKAASLRPDCVLESWLHETTRLTALSFLRRERRRQFREQEAYMQSALPENNDAATWNQLAPLLDEAVSRLGKKDRDAVMLRFFKDKNLREVAAALNINEAAAQRRVLRAVEKLRRFFTKRGVSSTTAIIAGTISANSVQAAPLALAKSVTAVAIAKGAVASGSTLTLIKGALKLMAWTKAKMTIVVGVGVLLAAGATTVVVEKAFHPKLSETDLSWADDPRYWELNSRVLEKIPPVIILRTTKFSGNGGNIQVGNKYLYRDATIQNLIATAYGFNPIRTILPDGLPADHFDLMLTLPNNSARTLQDKIKNKFGLAAHHEKRQTDVLYLRLRDANAPGIAVSKGGNQYWSGKSSTGSAEEVATNIPFGNMLGFFEGRLNKPTIDQTALKEHYDVRLKWQWDDSFPEATAFKQSLLDQLGLEVVPGRESIEMLVVEKVK